MAELKRLAKDSEQVYLATDLDREGEAIAWHLKEALGLPDNRVKRVIFNAITKAEIQKAFATPHAIDINPGERPSRPAASSTGSSGTRSARCCGGRSPRASAPAACSRSPSG